VVAKEILKVLYAPHKVFKEIIQKPGYIGPLILLLIFVLAQVGTFYVSGSRLNVEMTAPDGASADVWTENATLWQANSGVLVSTNFVDFINGTQAISGFPDYYGNSSIEFQVNDTSTLQMTLNDFGSQVNCGADGFKEVFFRVKTVTPNSQPETVTLTLYSLNAASFNYDITSSFSDSVVNVWNNITVPVGSGSWQSGGNPSWENITGIQLVFTWSTNSNVDMLLDGLFFRGKFENQIELVGGTLPYLANSALNGFAPFLFEWLLLTGIMYLLIKGLKGNVIWRPLMVAVGYALVVIVIRALLVAAVYTTLPQLYYPLELLTYVPGEFQVARDALISQLATVNLAEYIIQIAVWIWTVALGVFVTRAITSDKQIAEQVGVGKTPLDAASSGEPAGFSWMKCLLVSGASLFLTIIILGFLGV
jgi:hypothetical protein